jgi:hypothetical protein
MNRRGFLRLLAPAAALIAAPELLLPRRTFFLPPAGGWGGDWLQKWVHADVRQACQAALGAAYRAAYPPLMVDDMTFDLTVWGTSSVEIYGDPLLVKRLSPGAVHWGGGVRPVLLR